MLVLYLIVVQVMSSLDYLLNDTPHYPDCFLHRGHWKQSMLIGLGLPRLLLVDWLVRLVMILCFPEPMSLVQFLQPSCKNISGKLVHLLLLLTCQRIEQFHPLLKMELYRLVGILSFLCHMISLPLFLLVQSGCVVRQ